jgi:hypothetical protein
MSLVNRIGSSVLPFMNPRVVAPPGIPAHNGGVNIVVATPMRSGTHMLIDLLLNNLDEYRTRPLYVDLDACRRHSTPQRDLLAEITSDAGQILKTHTPMNQPQGAQDAPEFRRLADSGVVLTVKRERAAVRRSLAAWERTPEELADFDREYDAFWDFWSGRAALALDFTSLVDPVAVRDTLARIAGLTGTTPRARLVMPPSPEHRVRIYLSKGLTRVAGRRAPRIDTTIHTLKKPA